MREREAAEREAATRGSRPRRVRSDDSGDHEEPYDKKKKKHKDKK